MVLGRCLLFGSTPQTIVGASIVANIMIFPICKAIVPSTSHRPQNEIGTDFGFCVLFELVAELPARRIEISSLRVI